MVIGVRPECQGQGHGRRMLGALCRQAEQEGRAVYLETQTADNVRWYQGFGFQVLKEIPLSPRLTVWEMLRR